MGRHKGTDVFLGRRVRALQARYRRVRNLDRCLVQGLCPHPYRETKPGLDVSAIFVYSAFKDRVRIGLSA